MSTGFLRFLRGNSIALLALFVALGGTTYAATALPRNSVGSKQLKRNAVTATKIATNAVGGAKIANNSVKGDDILESSLGKVPSAANADNATNATNATHATDADTVGGRAANALLRVAAGRNGGDQFFAVSGDKTWTSATITAPSAGYLLVSISGYTFSTSGSGIVQHHATVDSEVLNNAVTLLSSSDVVSASPRQAISGTRLIPVGAGPHTVNFVGRVQTGTANQFGASFASISVLFVPFDALGVATAAVAKPAAVPAAEGGSTKSSTAK
jgi:hypothetical protein